MNGLVVAAVGLPLILIVIGLIFLVFRMRSEVIKKDVSLVEMQEIIERRTSEIDHLIHLDAVTHFYKRRKLLPKIDAVIAQNIPFILYVVNVKNLKSIDDYYSYRIGDITRNRVSAVLKGVFSSERILFGRYYDNYYIVDYTSEAVKRSDDMIGRLRTALNQTIAVEAFELSLQTSVGIIDYQRGLTSLEFMNRGDIAVLEIANKPDVFFIRYNQEFHNFLHLQNAMKQDLVLALNNNDLTLYFQPQIDVKSGKMYSCEALLRWFKADGTSFSPGVFIPLAEKNGLMGDLGDWVIDACCSALKKFHNLGITNSIAMNISPHQISTELYTKLENGIRKYEVDASRMCLEITETALWDDTQETINILNRIRTLGVQLALDDFGVGYSSLKHLKNLRIDKLKIDKSFIDTIDQLETIAIIKAIVELGTTLDYVIIAEGVETEEQLTALNELGVNRIQGWYYSRALSFDDYLKYYEQVSYGE